MSEVITEQDLERAAAFQERIEEVAMKLAGTCEDLEIDFDVGTVEVSWEVPACRCGCSGYETHYKEFPLELCLGSMEEVGRKIEVFKQKEQEREEAKRKAAEERKKAEAEKAAKEKEERERKTYERLKDKFG